MLSEGICRSYDHYRRRSLPPAPVPAICGKRNGRTTPQSWTSARVGRKLLRGSVAQFGDGRPIWWRSLDSAAVARFGGSRPIQWRFPASTTGSRLCPGLRQVVVPRSGGGFRRQPADWPRTRPHVGRRLPNSVAVSVPNRDSRPEFAPTLGGGCLQMWHSPSLGGVLAAT